MKEQIDLFQATPAVVYPNAPGFKRRGTSSDAAPTIKRAQGLRALVLAEIKKAGKRGLTADEAAGKLGVNILAIRPRVSEHFKMNRIAESGMKRKNASGICAVVWIIAPTVGNSTGNASA